MVKLIGRFGRGADAADTPAAFYEAYSQAPSPIFFPSPRKSNPLRTSDAHGQEGFLAALAPHRRFHRRGLPSAEHRFPGLPLRDSEEEPVGQHHLNAGGAHTGCAAARA